MTRLDRGEDFKGFFDPKVFSAPCVANLLNEFGFWGPWPDCDKLGNIPLGGGWFAVIGASTGFMEEKMLEVLGWACWTDGKEKELLPLLEELVCVEISMDEDKEARIYMMVLIELSTSSSGKSSDELTDGLD
jgi:hypothetical protein